MNELKNNVKALKIIGTVTMLVGAVASLVGGFVTDQQQSIAIDNAVTKKFEEFMKKSEQNDID